MAEEHVPGPEYHVASYPAPGLRQIVRHITGNTAEGKSVFLESSQGEHYRYMVNNTAVTNLIYSTQETPVDLNNNVDIAKHKEKEVNTEHPRKSMTKYTIFSL